MTDGEAALEIAKALIATGILGMLARGGGRFLGLLEKAGPHVVTIANRWLDDRAAEREERAAQRLEHRTDRDAATGGTAAIERFASAMADVAGRLEGALAQARAEVAPTSDLPYVRTTSVPPGQPIIVPSTRVPERVRR